MEKRNDFRVHNHDKAGYIFIAGYPRSGTQYIAKVMTAAGLDVQHEAFGQHGISAFHIIPHLATIKQGIIIHLVRRPIGAISSAQTIESSWGYINEYTGIHRKQGGIIHAAMRLYLKFNLAIEQYTTIRIQVEQLESHWDDLCEIVGLDQQPMPDIPKDTHTRKHKYTPLGWHELEFRDKELAGELKEMSERYGY